MQNNKKIAKIKFLKERFKSLLERDPYAWFQKMKGKYGLNPETELKVWDGTMTEEAKKARCLSYEEIDKLTEELLKRGYRLKKSSAITPKGNYGLHRAPKQADAIGPQDLFFEQRFDEEEFVQLYNYFGRYENNFPDYFKSHEAYEEYRKTHDIWVIEDIRTNRPVGFSTFCISNDPEERALYQTEDNQECLYHDTFVLASKVQDKGIGSLFAKIFDAYYLRYFADKGIDINYALCTGEINTSHTNRSSKNFHEKYRGFGNWVESSAPLGKWLKRYFDVYKNVKLHGKPKKPEILHINPSLEGFSPYSKFGGRE